ncbi:molybdate ABC transporter substrate-binding protein [Neisseriaceae bacterium ESL0693]|nr:molybdate ABC transporter substrate-binding protein [Neisseriaceae bacterium ESL0693]
MTRASRLKACLCSLGILLSSGHTLAADITVSAAASLTNAFKDIASAYQQQYPQDKIKLNFGASGSLLQQIQQGAPVDVFASADQATMNQAQSKGLINPSQRTDFVRNTLVLITPKNNRAGIHQLHDLTQAKVQHIAIGQPSSVPAGRYAQAALQQQQLWQPLTTKLVNATNVRQALDYVAKDEAEAGFVFGTDAALIPDQIHVVLTVPTDVISYPIAPTANSKEPATARRFIQFIRSEAGQHILTRYGFRPVQ